LNVAKEDLDLQAKELEQKVSLAEELISEKNENTTLLEKEGMELNSEIKKICEAIENVKIRIKDAEEQMEYHKNDSIQIKQNIEKYRKDADMKKKGLNQDIITNKETEKSSQENQLFIEEKKRELEKLNLELKEKKENHNLIIDQLIDQKKEITNLTEHIQILDKQNIEV
jgi:hypothetical protein